MKPGDLRRFNDRSGTAVGMALGGKTFLVLEVAEGSGPWGVHILMDGKVVGPWGYPWVEQNSEVISETR